MDRRPLSGIRVMDFTWVRAGPWAAHWLAALGAEVIKCEWLQPGTGTFNGRGTAAGDGGGGALPPGIPPGFNSGGNFNDTNAGKLGVTINVRKPEGLALIKRLLGMSDIVIENFSSRVMSNWGLSYAEMSAINPQLVYVSMAGLGHVGRNHHYQTAGPIVQAISGLTVLSGLPGEQPAGWGWSYMDDSGGMNGLMGALTGLHYRNVTGKGQHIDLSQVAAAITLTGTAILDYTLHGRGARREGYPPGNRATWPGTPARHNYRGRIVAPHNAYRSAGGGHNDWFAIACETDTEWQALVEVMGAPAWALDAHFATNDGRIAHQDELDQHLEVWTKEIGKYELMRRCQAAGVRGMPVQSSQDRVDHDAQQRSQEMHQPHYHKVLGTNLVQNFPFTLSASPVNVISPAPLVGEHNRDVLVGMLGVPDEQVRAGYENDLFWPQSLPMQQYLLDDFARPVAPRPPEVRPHVIDRGRAQRFSEGPVGDLRVLELADEKGEWCGKLLADLGADVIKIEPPDGAAERSIGPFYEDTLGPERSLHFWHYNTSKRGVTLDLESNDGRERFRQLVRDTDVLLETYAPGYMASIGLGYDQLRELNPRLIMCSLTDFGQTGPWKDYKASDLVHLAAGGQMGCCGYNEEDVPGAPPIAPGGGNAWHMGSHYAYIAILAAVNHRDYTGVGQYIDASVHGACALTTEAHVATWIYNKQIVTRNTGRHASVGASPRTQYPTKDGRFVNSGGIARFTPERFTIYVDWMREFGLAEDLTDEKYRDQAVIIAERQHILDVIERFYANMTQEDIYHGAQERGFPTGAIRAVEDNLADPHWSDRGFWVEVEHPELGRRITYPGAASIYNASPWQIYRRAPLLGEHNQAVLGTAP